MADNKVAFELVSPERLVVSMPVDMVVVPGGEGDFGVLPGHAPLIASVRPGVIEIYDGREVSDRIFVAGGFAEFCLNLSNKHLLFIRESLSFLLKLQRK